MQKKDTDDYKVCIWGTTVSKQEANKIGIAIIFGIIGICLYFFFFGAQNKVAAFIISFALAAVGYFGIANRIYNNNRKT